MPTSDEARLLGTWRTDPDDRSSLRDYGEVSLRFETGDLLVYTVHSPSKEQIMRLRYRVEGTCLITDQPSSPREERTEYFFTPDGRLAIKNASGQTPSFYVRGK